MKFLAVLAVAGALALCSLRVDVTPQSAHAVINGFTGGDSVLAAAGSFKIYPLFRPGGGHIHDPQWVGIENGFASAQRGWLYTTNSALRVKMWGPDCDTSGVTIDANGTQTALPTIDSIQVLNTGGGQTRVSWGLYR